MRYGDVVIVEGGDSKGVGGKPLQSFYCDGSTPVPELVDLADGIVKDRKLSALRAGDQIPVLRVGRVSCDTDKPNHPASIDFNFRDAKDGLKPSPKLV